MRATERSSGKGGVGLPDTSLSLEEVFDILRDVRRRRTVLILSSYSGATIEVSTLASELAEYETGENSTNRCYVALIQQHLPLLDDNGVVSYDEDEKVVTPEDIYCLSRLIDETMQATAE